jgi:hypothetical protein
MRMLHGDERLPQGIVHHSKRHPDNIRKVAVTCLLCGTERFVIIPRGKQRVRDGFTGACHACAIGKRKDVWRHPSGATILWGKREKGKHKEVPFICLHCGKEKIVWATQIFSKAKTWLGWCSDCIEARGSHRKLIEDKKLQPWGSWIFFSQRTATHIPVKCGLCGRTRMMAEGSVLANWQRRMTGYCPNRFECNKARLELGEDKELGNENVEPSKVEEKRRRGPVPKPAGKFLADVRAVIREIYSKLKLDRAVTLPLATARLQLLSYSLGEEGVRKKVKRTTGQTWETFVEHVLKDCG